MTCFQLEFKYWTKLFAFKIALISLKKGINLTILLPAMSTKQGQTGLFNLGKATGLGEEKTAFYIALKPLKIILLPAMGTKVG